MAKKLLDGNANLEGIINSAKAIKMVLLNENDYQKLLTAQTHLRPTAKGVSLVSINENTPQKRARDIEFLSKIKIDIHHKDDPEVPKRNTPEKKLQSWLISDSYRNRGRMLSIEKTVRERTGSAIDIEVYFVTDEIGLVSKITGKLVKCDILAVRKETKKDGSINWVPMQIELKSARYLQELIEQLENYEELFEKSRNKLEELFDILLAPVLKDKIVFGSSVLEKWIVWPCVDKADPKTIKKIAEKGIKEIQYKEQYSFK